MRLVVLSLTLLLLYSTGLGANAQEGPYGLDPDAYILRYKHLHSPEIGRAGMVSTQNDIATRIGVDILEEGGNAFDASVAVAFALAVTLPRAGNLGGGGFMLAYDHESGVVEAIDYRETTPAALPMDYFLTQDGEKDLDSRFDWGAVGTPGTVAGLYAVWEKHGSMPWKELVEPAIALAEGGFPVSYDLAEILTIKRAWLSKNPAALRAFYNEGGEPYLAGQLMRRPDLAWTLHKIADEGAAAFYEGEIAERIVADMERHGGYITAADLAGYEVAFREPVSGTYRGFDIVSMSPPSSGGTTIIEILNILENFPIADWGQSARTLHVLAESMKIAFADRAVHVADPDYYDVPLSALASKTYAKQQADRIKLGSVLEIAESPLSTFLDEGPDTTHFSIVDREGNAVSNTYTLSSSFGVGLVIEDTGILLNNQLHTFSVRAGVPGAVGFIASEANKVEPGKRPLSSQSPTMVFRDGSLYMVVGSPGGSRIITAVVQVISNVIDFNMNIAEATHQPRIHHQWLDDELEMEPGFSRDTVEILESWGHNIAFGDTMGSTQSILSEKGYLFGASDPRRPNALTVGID